MRRIGDRTARCRIQAIVDDVGIGRGAPLATRRADLSSEPVKQNRRVARDAVAIHPRRGFRNQKESAAVRSDVNELGPERVTNEI